MPPTKSSRARPNGTSRRQARKAATAAWRPKISRKSLAAMATGAMATGAMATGAMALNGISIVADTYSRRHSSPGRVSSSPDTPGLPRIPKGHKNT